LIHGGEVVPIIQVENARYRYGEEKKMAVDGVTLNVEKGEFVAVLGHNGSGKSTLAKLINALFLPTEGRVLVAGLDTAGKDSAWDVRRHCGMVFQNPDNQLVATVVEEDVAFGLENIGVPTEEIRRRVDEALDMVGMLAYARHAPHMLSGGQKQRVAIAGVVAMRPDVIVFDEATAMLDPSGRRDVMAIAQALNREGITVVWITHFMREASLAGRVIVMDKGKIALEGSPVAVFEQVDRVRALGLDVPEMVDLAGQLREKGVPLPEGVMTVDEMVVELCRLK
jgi:energy-coupling factor transport system ATP-binding protein